MPRMFLLRAAFTHIMPVSAALLMSSFPAFTAHAEPVLPVQSSINIKAENTASLSYSPPIDVPIPQPKIKPIAKTPPAAPSNAPGQSSPIERTEQNIVSPQNLPVPSPAPALPSSQTDNMTGEQKPAAPNTGAVDTTDKIVNDKAGGETNIGLADAQKLAQNLADKFSQIRVMIGEFVQFDARGGMTTGIFYLERPGKILFDYKDTPLRVICDGQTIAVNNRKLRSWSLYELGKSPLNLLLADKINIANGRLLEFTQEPNAVILVLGDSTGRAKIRMIFDAKTYELKQWTMTENGQDTTIQVVNTKTDIEFADNMFNINYYRFPKKQ